MKLLFRGFVIVVGGGLVFLGLATVLAASQLDQWARRALEYQLAKILDAPVTVGQVSMSPLDRSVEIRNLVLSNPRSFDVGPAVEIPRASVTLEPASIFSDRLEIPSIEVDQAHIHLRYTMEDGTNIGVLTSRAKEWRDRPRWFFKPKAYHVAKLTSTGATMTTHALGRSATVPLANMTLNELESKRAESTGTVAANVLQRWLDELLSAETVVEGLRERLGEEWNRWMGEIAL